MQKLLEGILTRRGTQVEWIRNGQSTALRGFFQPVTSRSWQRLKREVSVLGEAPVGLYVFFAPADAQVRAGDILVVGAQRYGVRRSEALMLGDQVLYRWALCARKGGEEA